MAAIRWRLRRLVSIETNLITHELEERSDTISRYVKNPTKDKTLAWTFDRISGGTSLSLLPRYEGTLHRNFDRALRQLLLLRAQPKSPTTNRTEAPASET